MPQGAVPIPQDATVAGYGMPIPEGATVGEETKPSLLDKINKPLISGEKLRRGFEYATGVVVPGSEERATEKYIFAGRPVMAGLSAFGTGMEKSLSDLASSFTSPASIAMTAAGGGAGALAGKSPMLARLLKLLTAGGLAAYGASGAKQALTPQQPGEATPEMLERRLMGAVGAAGSAAGLYGMTAEGLRNSLRKHMGLNDDLASKVTDKILEKQRVEAKTQSEFTRAKTAGEQAERGIRSQTAQKISDVETETERNIAASRSQTAARITGATQSAEARAAAAAAQIHDLETQKVQTGARILADTTQYLHQEKSAFRAKFSNLDSKLTEAVAAHEDISSAIKEEFANKNVTEAEIPPAALKALRAEEPSAGRTEVWLTKNELQTLNVLYREGARGEDLRGSLVNMGYAPKQIDSMMQTVGEAAKKAGLSSAQVTRIRGDLFDASEMTKDPAVKAALSSAYERVSDIQEKAFEKAGMGKQYVDLKNQYRDFMRGINSDMVHKLISSYDKEDQGGPELDRQIKMLTTGGAAPALHSVLKSVGIDAKPLLDIIRQSAELEKEARLAPAEGRVAATRAARAGALEESRLLAEGRRVASDVLREGQADVRASRASTSTELKGIISEGERGVKAAEAEGEIVPGKKTSELANLSNQQLIRDRLVAQANEMKSSGIRSPYALVQNVIGYYLLMKGSPFGLYHLARGKAMTMVPEMMADPKFQAFILKDTGVTPTSPLGKRILRGAAQGLARAAATVPSQAANRQQTGPAVP
jgi:hypothetical protein